MTTTRHRTLTNWGAYEVETEFGQACAFLCGAGAGYITGQNLLIDGGGVNLTL